MSLGVLHCASPTVLIAFNPHLGPDLYIGCSLGLLHVAGSSSLVCWFLTVVLSVCKASCVTSQRPPQPACHRVHTSLPAFISALCTVYSTPLHAVGGCCVAPGHAADL